MEQVAERLNPSDDALRRVVGHYHEMPGLSLSAQQAARLWGLDVPTCERILEKLVQRDFLRRTPRGLYVRTSLAA